MKHSRSRSRLLVERLKFIFVILGLLGISGLLSSSANANEDDVIWCRAGDDKQKIWYMSAPFLGDYLDQSTRTKLDFLDFLKSQGKSPSILRTICWLIKDKQDLEYKIRRIKSYPYNNWSRVYTKWKPGYSIPLPQGDGDSDDSQGRESGGDGCYFGECPDGANPAPRSPNTPVPSQETSQRTTICQTSVNWCAMSSGLPVGVPCGCPTPFGPVGGITVRSRP